MFTWIIRRSYGLGARGPPVVNQTELSRCSGLGRVTLDGEVLRGSERAVVSETFCGVSESQTSINLKHGWVNVVRVKSGNCPLHNA